MRCINPQLIILESCDKYFQPYFHVYMVLQGSEMLSRKILGVKTEAIEKYFSVEYDCNLIYIFDSFHSSLQEYNIAEV